MPAPKLIPPEALEKARRLYEETDIPLADIANLLGVNETTVYRRARKHGWTPRRRAWEGASPHDVLLKHGAAPVLAENGDDRALPEIARNGGNGLGGEIAGDGTQNADAIPDLEALAARVEQAAKLQIIKVERLLRLDASAEVETQRGERAARTLASLAQSVAVLRRTLKAQATGELPDDAVRSEDDIRRELSAALERIVAGRTADAGGGPEPSGA
jgi:uncharacterized protein YjcR